MQNQSERPVPASAAQHPAHGRHLLLTLGGCPAALLDDQRGLELAVRAAAAATGATVLQLAAHQFAPQGVTLVALLAESHASLHTYPEHGVAFWDCFTCGDRCDPQHSVAVLAAALQAGSVEQRLVLRGGQEAQKRLVS